MENTMDSYFDPDLKEFRGHIARWVDERLIPQADALDRSGGFPRGLFKELGGLGYFGVMYPERYGGSGLERPYLHYTVLCEELARGSMGFAAIVGMHASAATHTIFAWGSESLRQRYLVPAIRGDMVGAFAITEANAGRRFDTNARSQGRRRLAPERHQDFHFQRHHRRFRDRRRHHRPGEEGARDRPVPGRYQG
jgi:alkylation response protein AidB-like acyl-CoA dehydrogenase